MIDALILSAFSCGYLAASLVLAAMFVRVAPGSALSNKIRRRSWLIPVVPVVIPVWLAGRILLPIPGFAAKLFRDSFRRLSGKRLYRRVAQGPYSGYAGYRRRRG